jgi:hypothetical protein
MPLPFATAWLVETDDWHSTTWSLRRFTDKQRIALLGRGRRYGCKASGPGIPLSALPVIAVMDHVDLFETMEMVA